MPVRALAPQPPLSCSAEPLPSEITGTCTGEVAAGWPRQAESWGVGQAPWQGTAALAVLGQPHPQRVFSPIAYF